MINIAAILTWAERRQSAMIQDRIGPNRAVIYLPSDSAQVAVAAARARPRRGGLAIVAWLASKRSAPVRLDVGFTAQPSSPMLRRLVQRARRLAGRERRRRDNGVRTALGSADAAHRSSTAVSSLHVLVARRCASSVTADERVARSAAAFT